MKCKIILDTEIVPSFEDFEKANEFTFVGNLTNSISKLIHYSNHGWLLNEEQKLYKLNQGWNFVYLGKLQPSKTFNSSLTFDTLRKANTARIPEFKNSKGLPAHSKPDGSDWSPAQWLQAVIGELGEYANVMKKVERGDLTFDEVKPLIEKELADVMTYLDLLAFRVCVDLSKAVEQKFNEVSERVGCSLRIENNKVVRKETEKSYCGTGQLTVDSKNCSTFIQIPSGINTTSILKNYDYNSKNGELTPKQKFVTKLQTEQEFFNNRYKLSNQELFVKKSFSSDMGGALNEIIRWKLFKNYAEIYPLKIPHNAIDDVYSFEFQGIDNGKQYLFYHAKRIFHARENMNLRVVAIAQSNIFEYFSKQLGTKIEGMLINGSKENTKLNPGDLIQFHDDRNVLYNFRLVKSSDKNVEVSLS